MNSRQLFAGLTAVATLQEVDQEQNQSRQGVKGPTQVEGAVVVAAFIGDPACS